MNIVDKLMQVDAGKIKRREGIYRMKLSRVGDFYEFPCVEVDSEEVQKLAEGTLNMNVNGGYGISTFDMKIRLIMLGCETFRSHDLKEHFGCTTSKDLIKKLLTREEINDLADYIMALGGRVEDTEQDLEEIKN